MNSMKRIIYWAALILPLLAGCTKPSSYPDAPAPEQYDRYIFFSHGVETKASLIESAADLDGKAFGVVGFKYDFYDKDGNEVFWKDHKNTNPTPNVFYDEVVNSEGTSTYDITPVETVWVTAGAQGTNVPPGTPYYEPLQGWSNVKQYTFFAFYPMPNDNVTLVNSSDGSKYTGGVPAIKYTMDVPSEYPAEGPADGSAFVASMVDLMTADPMTNLYWKSASDYNIPNGNNSSNGEVNFRFTHRLSCLGLKVKNLTAGGITINSVTFNISGIKNQSVIFPLDGSSPYYGNEQIGYIACGLGIKEDESDITTTDGLELSNKLIFIPQESDVTFTVTVGYTRSLDGYINNQTYSTDELSTELTKGQKYLVNLNFKDSTVDASVTDEAWVVIPKVEDTFI